MAIARDAVQLATQLGYEDRIQSRRGLYGEDYFVRIGLYAKGIDIYRAILHLLEYRFTVPCQILCRALTESGMAFEFLCRYSIRLWEYKNKKKCPLKLFGKRLTRHFRTALYMTHCTLEERRWLDEAGALGNPREWRNAKKAISLQLTECEQEIGSQWFQRLEASRTYSGVSIRQTAYCLGIQHRKWYNAVYRDQSRAVHAADPKSYVAWSDEDCLTAPSDDSDEAAAIALNLSTLVFFQMLHRFAKTFYITDAQSNKFWDLYQRLAEID